MKALGFKGFTIVEVVVATAVWSILAMGITYSIISQKQHAVRTEQTNDAMDIANKLSDYVNSNVFCESIFSTTSTLNSRVLTANWNNLDIRSASFTINNATVTTGSQLDNDGKLEIVQARYRVKPGSTAQEKNIVIGIKNELRRIAQVELEIGLFKNGVYERSIERRYLEVPVMTKGQYIVSCDLKVTNPEICSALGMEFDTVLGVCAGEGDLGCEFLGSYIKADIDDNLSSINPTCDPNDTQQVNTVTGGCSCPVETNTQRSFGPATIDSTTVTCGKKCGYTVYTQYEVIGCFKCGGN